MITILPKAEPENKPKGKVTKKYKPRKKNVEPTELSTVVSEMQSEVEGLNAVSELEMSVRPNKYRQHWLSENMKARDTPYSLSQLAQDFGVSYGHIRILSCKGKWNEALTRIKEARDGVIQRKIQEVQIINEVEVRSRQAQFARLAMNKAILRIQAIDHTKLSVREAIELLRLGLTEERKALGLIDSVVYPVVAGDSEANNMKIVKEAMALIDSIHSHGADTNVIDADPS